VGITKFELPRDWLHETVARALAEDVGAAGDVTTDACVPYSGEGPARIEAREAGVLYGLEVVEEVFVQASPGCCFRWDTEDGQAFPAGWIIGSVWGPTREVLTAERTALNFLQRLCGIATLTRQYVQAVAGTRAVILDTRKTTPGLRLLEKAAVRAGGGKNHRFGLSDGVLIKDNHLVAAGGIRPAVEAVRAHAHHLLKIEVEVTTLAGLEEALATGAEAVLLDNMTVAEMAEAVKLARGLVLLEASGGVSLETVGEIARTGVDFISVGKLTHSAPALDLSLELEREDGEDD
jgi:nicotinate-nucleotide pyrophosphorylase (carboxylating)